MVVSSSEPKFPEPYSKEQAPVHAVPGAQHVQNESTALLSGTSDLTNQVGNYFTVGSTTPQIVSAKFPPAANQALQLAQNDLTSQLNTNFGPLASAPPQSIGAILPFGKTPLPEVQGQDDAEGKAADDRIHHFLVAYPRAHEGEAEDFSFSLNLKDMASYMRDLEQISTERKASPGLLRDIARVNQFYSEIYDLALGSAAIHRAIKRIIDQYNLVTEDRNVDACNSDLKFIAANLPGKQVASQLLYDELLTFQNRAHARDISTKHRVMMAIISVPLAIHNALNAFMTLRNSLRAVFLAVSFATTMIGVTMPDLSEQTALIANLFNFVVFLDMLFTQGGESILLSMVGTPDLEQRFEELVIDTRQSLSLHTAATKKIVEATKAEIENQVPDDDWNLRHMYHAYMSNWALDSKVFTNPLNDERMF